MEETLPVCDVKAECRILASILEDSANFDEVSEVLEPEHIFNDANRVIYKAIQTLVSKGDEVNLVSIRDYLFDNNLLQRVGEDYLESTLFVLTPAVTEPYRDALRIAEMWRVRQVQAICKQFIAASKVTALEEMPDLLAKLEGEITQQLDTSSSVDAMGMKEAVITYSKTLMENLQRAQELRAAGLPDIELTTGLEELDRVVGGLHRGDVTVIAGRPGMGKSAVGIHLVMTAATCKSYSETDVASAFVSLEMPRDQVIVRMACMDGSVDVSKVRKKSLDQSEQSAYFAAMNRISKLPIEIINNTYRVSDIRSAIRRAKAKYTRLGKDLAVVVIDYLQLITDKQSGNQTRENVVSEISRSLKILAVKENVALIVLAQLNRECEVTKSKKPQLHNLRESGAIEQDADVVVFLYRKSYYWPNNDRYRNLLELIVAKQRNGPTEDGIMVAFREFCTRLDNVDDPIACRASWSGKGGGDE